MLFIADLTIKFQLYVYFMILHLQEMSLSFDYFLSDVPTYTEQRNAEHIAEIFLLQASKK